MNRSKIIFYLDGIDYLQNIFNTLGIHEIAKLKYSSNDFENLISKIPSIKKVEKLFYHLDGIIIPVRENGQAIFSLEITKDSYLEKILKDGV